MATDQETSAKGLWYWQSNHDTWSETEEKTWERYTDPENQLIETAYLNRQETVIINEKYYIDLKGMRQINRHYENKQRPVKREQAEHHRFYLEHQPNPEKAVPGAPGEKPKFIDEWIRHDHENSYYLSNVNAEAIVLKVVQGIQEEARLAGKEEEGIALIKQLQDPNISNLEELSAACIRVYTSETFLYALVNQCLREEDMSKIPTLGPFCFLFYNALWLLRSDEETILYRSEQLTDEMIHDFKNSIGQQRSWKAFTSATTSRERAAQFGNTIFIILVVQLPFKPAYWTDVSKYSLYPDEAEVILSTAVTYMISEVSYDQGSNKHQIYVTL